MPVRLSRPLRLSLALRAALGRGGAPTVNGSAPAPLASTSSLPPRWRWRESMSLTDRVTRLEEMVRRAKLGRSLVVAVVSARGGVGRTTVAALVGTLVAELRWEPTVVVDAHPGSGGIRRALLGPERSAMAADELMAWLASYGWLQPATVHAMLARGPHGVGVVPGPIVGPGAWSDESVRSLYSGLIDRLRSFAGLVIVDCAPGLGRPWTAEVLARADQVLLVCDDDVASAQSTVGMASQLSPQAEVFLIASRLNPKRPCVDFTRLVGQVPRDRRPKAVVGLPLIGRADHLVTPGFDWAQAPLGLVEPLHDLLAVISRYW